MIDWRVLVGWETADVRLIHKKLMVECGRKAYSYTAEVKCISYAAVVHSALQCKDCKHDIQLHLTCEVYCGCCHVDTAKMQA